MEDIVFTIYPPEKLEYDSDKDNNRSLVTVVQHGDVRMLLAGDAEKERIDEILTGIPDLESDLLKVPHHGHEEKNSEELFKAAGAQYAVICADGMTERTALTRISSKRWKTEVQKFLSRATASCQAVSDGKESECESEMMWSPTGGPQCKMTEKIGNVQQQLSFSGRKITGSCFFQQFPVILCFFFFYISSGIRISFRGK